MRSFEVVVGSERNREVRISGKVVFLPEGSHPTLEQAQATFGSAALLLELLQELLKGIHPQLPEGPEPMLEGNTPMALGPELKSILECLISDDIEPAIDKLHRAASVTDAQLLQEWEERGAFS